MLGRVGLRKGLAVLGVMDEKMPPFEGGSLVTWSPFSSSDMLLLCRTDCCPCLGRGYELFSQGILSTRAVVGHSPRLTSCLVSFGSPFSAHLCPLSWLFLCIPFPNHSCGCHRNHVHLLAWALAQAKGKHFVWASKNILVQNLLLEFQRFYMARYMSEGARGDMGNTLLGGAVEGCWSCVEF